MNWNMLISKSGYPSLEVKKEHRSVLIHSKYDPIKEAQQWVAANVQDLDGVRTLVIVGLGMGYHVGVLAKKYPELSIEVWDFNLQFLEWLNKRNLLEWIYKFENVKVMVENNLVEIKKSLLPRFNDEKVKVLFHFPALELIPENLNSIRNLISKYELFLKTAKRSSNRLDYNFNKNLELSDEHIGTWIDKYKVKPMILVSAGPSLTQQLPLIKRVKEQDCVVIGCVGTAVKPLIKAGVTPDFVMISDPYDAVAEQLRGFSQVNIPLFYLATANYKAIINYPGPRFVVWQKGYLPSRKRAKDFDVPLINTGGSVATCLFDLMVKMGTGPIALVGQDLAFTSGVSHAAGTHAQREIQDGYSYLYVLDWYRQEQIPTSKSLNSFRKWFEECVKTRNDADRFWNCTEGGAYIKGFIHKSLREYIKEYCL